MKSGKTRSKDEVEKAVNKKSKGDKPTKSKKAEKPKLDLSELTTFVKKSDSGRVVLSVQEYGGKHYVDIRHYYKDKASGEWKPTKKGTTIPLEKGQKVAKKLRMLIASASEAGLETAEE